MAMGIYKIINVVNNKFYVGSAVNFQKRKMRHFNELRQTKHNNSKLQNAWNKYGEKSFVFVVVEEITDRSLLLDAENKWLKEHVGKDYCYNLGVDATAPMLGFKGELSPTYGYKHTPESLKKISKTSKSRIQTDAEKAKRRQTMLGHPVSIVTKVKISATLSGPGNYWYGKKRPDHGEKVMRQIVAIDPQGQEHIFPSITAFRLAYKVTPPTVNRSLKSGVPLKRGKMKGWLFKYISNPVKAVLNAAEKAKEEGLSSLT